MSRYTSFNPLNSMISTHYFLIVVLLVAGLTPQMPASGSSQPETTMGESDNSALRSEAKTTNSLLASRLSQIATFVQSQHDNGSLEDMLAAKAIAALIAEAQQLDPDSKGVSNILAYAAENAGWADLAYDSRRSILASDPANEVNQYLLIQHRLRTLQTIEDRLSAYDRLLGTPGRALTPSVRSQLALELAFLNDQLGRSQSTVDAIRLSVKLDPTHSEAAERLALVAAQTSASIPDHFRAGLAWCLADPLNVDAAFQLAIILRDAGAYSEALESFENLIHLHHRQRQTLPQAVALECVLAILAKEGSKECLSWLRTYSSYQSLNLESQLQFNWFQPETTPKSADQLNDLHSTNPIEFNIIQLAAAQLAGDKETHTKTFATLESQWIEEKNAIGMANSEDRQTTDSKQTLMQIQVDIQNLWVVLWLGDDICVPESDALRNCESTLQRLIEASILPAGVVQRFEGWMAFRKGDLERAQSLLDPQAAHDAASAIGMAMIHASRHETNAAIRLLANVSNASPGSIESIWSKKYTEEFLMDRKLPANANASAIRKMMFGNLKVLRSTTRSTQPLLDASLHLADTAQDSDSSSLYLTVTNTCRIPLRLPARLIIRFESVPTTKPAEERGNLLPVLAVPLPRFALNSGETLRIPVGFEYSAVAFAFARQELDEHKQLHLYVDLDEWEHHFDSAFGRPSRTNDVDEPDLTVVANDLYITRPTSKERLGITSAQTNANFIAIAHFGSMIRQSKTNRTTTTEIDADSNEHYSAQLVNLAAQWDEMSSSTQAWVLLQMPRSTESILPIAVAQFEQSVKHNLNDLALLAWVLTRQMDIDSVELQQLLDSDAMYSVAIAEYILTRLK